jgi:hypothetical protein
MMVAGAVSAANEQSFSDFPPGTTAQAPPATPGEPTTNSVRALTFFNDRATWLADPLMSGLTTTFEDFSATLVPPDGVLSCPAPFNSTTNNACFAPGGIAVGVSVGVIDTQGDPDGVVLTPPFFGVDCVSVGPNNFINDGTLDFNPPVRGVGLDLIAPFGPADFVIDIYDPAGALLGSTTSTGQVTSAGAFFGVVSDDITGIGQLHFSSAAGDGELFCNVEWAGPPVPVELQSFTIK